MAAWEYGYLRTSSQKTHDGWKWSASWFGPNADLAECDVTDGLIVDVKELGKEGWELATVEWSEGDVIAIDTGSQTHWLACDRFGWRSISGPEPTRLTGRALSAAGVYHHIVQGVGSGQAAPHRGTGPRVESGRAQGAPRPGRPPSDPGGGVPAGVHLRPVIPRSSLRTRTPLCRCLVGRYVHGTEKVGWPGRSWLVAGS
jgi:hypothetical protein